MVSVEQRLKQLCIVAQAFFSDALTKSDEAIDYLEERGLVETDVYNFGLGYCHRGLVKYFTYTSTIEKLLPYYNNAKGLSSKEEFIDVLHNDLVKIGLLGQNEDRMYPVLNERVIFPIKDVNGDIVSFAGRVINQKSSAKYINGKTSAIYEKNETIYGLERIKLTGRKMRFIPVLEGYLDVIAMGRVGLFSAALCGTACTKEHLAKLFHYTDMLVMCLDGDKAGLEAMMKSVVVSLPLLEGNRSIMVKLLDVGEDPDSIITKSLETTPLEQVKRSMLNILSDSVSLAELLEISVEKDYPNDPKMQDIALASYALKTPINSSARSEILNKITLRGARFEQADLNQATATVAEVSNSELRLSP